jgi:hypothetical protein
MEEQSTNNFPATGPEQREKGRPRNMPSSAKTVDNQTNLPASELLRLYDELTALHACSAFVMQALAATLVGGGGLDERSATGAVFCTQWLNDRTEELERQIKSIVSQACASATAGGS